VKLTNIHETIEFKVTGEKSVFNISSLDESIETVYNNSSPVCKYIPGFTVDVYAVAGMGEIIADMGFLKGISIEAEVTFTNVNSFLELCDMVSADLYHMAEAVTGKNGSVRKSICPLEKNIMYIENIYIEEKYRSLGIGRYLLDNVGSLFFRSLNYSHHVHILKPFPQVKCGKHSLRNIETAASDEIARLAGFYKKSGYRFIKSTDYMYKIQSDGLFQMLEI